MKRDRKWKRYFIHLYYYSQNVRINSHSFNWSSNESNWRQSNLLCQSVTTWNH